MQEDNNVNVPFEEEEGIDIMALVKQLWEGRKTVIICTCIFIALGFAAALTMRRTYTVSTVMVPQVGSRSSSSLSSLASLAGFDLSSMSSSTELSPLIYPQIVNSVPFRRELMHTPLHYTKADTAVSMYAYARDYEKPGPMSIVLKYTIGLPGVIIQAIRGEKSDSIRTAAYTTDSDEDKPLLLTNAEVKILKAVAQSVSLSVDKKEGYVTLTVIGSEPLQAAELAMKAQQLLQDEITRFRVEKSQSELDYIQARYNEVKMEVESYQEQLAKIADRSKQLTSAKDRIEQERLNSKYTIANSLYSELSKQLEQIKLQVKKDTPVFTIIQPVTVPSQPSNSRSKTLVVWTFLGFVLGCGIVLGRGYLPKLKEQFKNN